MERDVYDVWLNDERVIADGDKVPPIVPVEGVIELLLSFARTDTLHGPPIS